ncbi:hypothetical protein ACH4OY_26655 [Micromonospora rubida]|uniref:Uncharacterized protein n=1 Tax=Micromonospora rubida TaxID=2697657 RepID=A0ABW7SRB0_9ACTN
MEFLTYSAAQVATQLPTLLALLHPAGLGLVIAATLTGRRPTGGA